MGDLSKDFLNPDEQTGNDAMNLEDDGLVLNLDGVDEEMPGFEALPPGTYDCVVENTEFAPSSKGNPMITWVFKVIDPQYDGRLLFYHTVLNSDAGLSRLKRTLIRVVPDINMGEFRPNAFCNEGQALGYPCRVKVSVKPYQGQKRNNVTDVLPPSEGAGSFLGEEL